MSDNKEENSATDKAILLSSSDNILIALGNMNAGQHIKKFDLTIDAPILSGQKIAKIDIAAVSYTHLTLPTKRIV